MRIALGSDHAGFVCKEITKKILNEIGIAYEDFGTSNEFESVDYPDFAGVVGQSVASKKCDRGILFCGSGIGIGIAANKIKGIRAALVHDIETAHLAREHNDANIMTLGARNIDLSNLKSIIQEFINTNFAGGRHIKRIEKISELEKEI